MVRRTGPTFAACVAILGGIAAVAHADGPILQVTTPAAFELDFGALARGQLAARRIVIHNPGTARLDVALGPVPPLFGAPDAVSVEPGATAVVDVTCGADAATSAVTAALALTSNAQQSNTAAIALRCAVADTLLAIAPATLELGEVRRGSPARMLPVAIANPGPGAVTIDEARLVGAPSGLRLAPELTEHRTLAAGEELDLTLVLGSADEVDTEGAALSVELAGGEALLLPVIGRVVSPLVRITPPALDLGTACVGTQVAGTVRLTNAGSATLTAQEPELDRAFVTEQAYPAAYPAPLPPGAVATVDVTPRTSQIGPIEGTLTWDVDAPAAPYSVPVTLRYIDAGTAISPRSLIFGSHEVRRPSPRQVVTLENCNPQPIRLAIEGVEAIDGSVEAWTVEPASDERTLGPHDRLQVAAVFRPLRAGPHRAMIRIAVDGVAGEIELTGDGLGDEAPATSFYACTCSGGSGDPGGPVQALLLCLAVIGVLRRRRRPCPS